MNKKSEGISVLTEIWSQRKKKYPIKYLLKI